MNARPPSRGKTIYGILLASALAFILLDAVRTLPSEPSGLTRVVETQMANSGVEHPVTAVLLNFRGYDTWLELGVLLLAVMGVLLFQPGTDLARVQPLARGDAVLRLATSLLLPLAVLVAGYLLWIGKYASGGAFQAGVVLGAALILLWLSGNHTLVILPPVWFRLILVLGFCAFMVVALGLLVAGQGWLDLPPSQAGHLILFIEACATLSIAWTMAALIIGLQPPVSGKQEGGA